MTNPLGDDLKSLVRKQSDFLIRKIRQVSNLLCLLGHNLLVLVDPRAFLMDEILDHFLAHPPRRAHDDFRRLQLNRNRLSLASYYVDWSAFVFQIV